MPTWRRHSTVADSPTSTPTAPALLAAFTSSRCPAPRAHTSSSSMLETCCGSSAALDSSSVSQRSSESGSPIDTGISKIPDQTPELFYNLTKNELHCLKHFSVYFFVIYTFMDIVRLMQHHEYKSRNDYILFKGVPNICQSLRKDRLSRNEKLFQFQLFRPSCTQKINLLLPSSCFHVFVMAE